MPIQFSLRTLLMTTGLVALGIALIRAEWEVASELKIRRVDAYLAIGNPPLETNRHLDGVSLEQAVRATVEKPSVASLPMLAEREDAAQWVLDHIRMQITDKQGSIRIVASPTRDFQQSVEVIDDVAATYCGPMVPDSRGVIVTRAFVVNRTTTKMVFVIPSPRRVATALGAIALVLMAIQLASMARQVL